MLALEAFSAGGSDRQNSASTCKPGALSQHTNHLRRAMPIGESGLSRRKMVLVGGRVHDGMAILGDGIDALSATATMRALAI